MTKGEIIVFDVGHGSGALILMDNYTALIDAGNAAVILSTLRKRNIKTIDDIFISHADSDHISGLATILISQDIHKVGNLYINSDPSKSNQINSKGTKTYIDLAAAFANKNYHSKNCRDDRIHTHKSKSVLGLKINILSPDLQTCMIGPGGTLTSGQKITSNSMSAAISVENSDKSIIIFGGDIEHSTLNNIYLNFSKIKTDILVFPHHGGHCGSNDALFTQELLQFCSPSYVIFSNGRHLSFRNPLPDIVNEIKNYGSRIMCTQLSTNCLSHSSPINHKLNHLNTIPAAGIKDNKSCAGSILITFDNNNLKIERFTDHQNFILNTITSRICQ